MNHHSLRHFVLVTIGVCFLALLPSATPAAKTDADPARAYCRFALTQCDRIQRRLPAITKLAETVADRHLAGGTINFPWNYQSLQQELSGRAGGMVNMNHQWKPEKDRTAAEKSNDVAIIGWDRAPAPKEVDRLVALRKQGTFILGFGPKSMPALTNFVPLCDGFIDTGLPDDRVVTLADGEKVGRANHLVNALNGWVFVGELVAALTRQGKMPAMWKAYLYKDGREWGARYMDKIQFHEDFQVPPVKRGVLGRQYLDAIRALIRRFEQTQLRAVDQAADLVVQDLDAGKKPYLLSMGHMPWVYVGKYEDARWVTSLDFHSTVEYQVKAFREKFPEGGLGVRLGYFGEDQQARDLFREKNARLILITSKNAYPEMGDPDGVLVRIDMGMEFGDACLKLKGYPIQILPPSGVMQVVAYEAINTEVLARLAKQDQGRDKGEAEPAP
ncbi:hypothetical protein HQ590_14955 [bacterium]|nr:hypothetical protein [bacterium]